MRNESRICSYIMTHDHGLAPNPFYGYCTLAVCTPNHRDAKAVEGDWIIGHLGAPRGYKLVYAVRVDDVLTFDEYFHDRKFINKRPKVDGTWQDRRGDNMYYLDSTGHYQQIPTRFHTERETSERDKKHPRVFVASHFYYLGKKAVSIPSEFRSLICHVRQVRWNKDAKVNEDFLGWLRMNFNQDIVLAEPLDKDASDSCGC
jgi:Nucleotide modification associated domain 2